LTVSESVVLCDGPPLVPVIVTVIEAWWGSVFAVSVRVEVVLVV
jgi:hypothetical protein